MRIDITEPQFRFLSARRKAMDAALEQCEAARMTAQGNAQTFAETLMLFAPEMSPDAFGDLRAIQPARDGTGFFFAIPD